MRPLWQILITFKDDTSSTSLSCDECFSYMEHLVEEALAGIEEEVLQTAIKRHLDHCPDCQEHHLQRLTELEEKHSLPTKEINQD